MAVRCTVLINRTDVAGWSESYYINSGSIPNAITAFAPVLAARRLCLSAYCYVYGVRFTDTLLPRTSQLVINTNPQLTPSGSGTPNNFDPDLGVAGALATFTNSTGRSEERIVRGIPDDLVTWNKNLNRMELQAGLLGPLSAFATALTAATNSCGWFSRSTLLQAGSRSTPVVSVNTSSDGYVRFNIASSAGWNPVVDGNIIASGFKGQLAVLNGQYTALAWSVANPTAIGITKKLPDSVALSYPGTGGFIRLQNPTFHAYTPVTTWPGALVRSHRIGRPFGATRGRRRTAA